ncbi:accessory Sec system protein translocase subunit SecY2 [Streptococcus iniae]|uniref:accessory Sec system protein translocase subunit SecY2 n=1 Tax=Streptococcus iniae TaxID=1346 RepID=UPI00202E0A03|nr:accessory Sec system protein translocase subunit SecY2 [Streptococcus iniae]MCM0723987.1 accessory Sec system protein translocase subunit SecY2 [Streptococcus iniae]
MFIKYRNRQKEAVIRPKLMWTLLIIFIYMLGRMMPVTTVEMNQALLHSLESKQLLNSLASVTGGQLSNVTLFSLGLSPWMTTMILWRFFTVFGMLKELTTVQLHRYRMLLTLVIAVIQAVGLTVGAKFVVLEFFGSYGPAVAQWGTVLLLVTGAVVLSWLENINGQKGFGGMMIIVVVNMIISFQQNLINYFKQNTFTGQELAIRAILFIIVLVFLIHLTVILYRGEYRIPIKRIGINNAFNDTSYLPIRVTPAGAMPFMYGMTLMMLPPYIISILLHYLPNNGILIFLATTIGITKLPGAILYLTLLYILAIGFAYYNYDSYDIAKNMRNNGDFIEGIKPGQATKEFIHNKVKLLSQFGAIMVVLIGGGPVLIAVIQNSGGGNISIAMLISNAYIITTLILAVVEQVNTLQNWKKYRNLI